MMYVWRQNAATHLCAKRMARKGHATTRAKMGDKSQVTDRTQEAL